MEEHNQAHPADTLANALDRANGLLGTLGQLFDPTTDTFSGGNAFIAHAMITASTLIADARIALEDLHYSCDLTLLDMSSENDSVIEMNFQKSDGPPSSSNQPDVSFVEIETQDAEVVEKADEQEFVAKTYLELLRKLTAAEIFAAEQQALSMPGTSRELLPLLQSLREDIEKIHKVA